MCVCVFLFRFWLVCSHYNLNSSWSLWCVLREVRFLKQQQRSGGQGSQEQIWHVLDTNILTIRSSRVCCGLCWSGSDEEVLRLYVNNLNCRNKPANGEMKCGKNRSDDRRKRTWWMEWWREERPSLESDCWTSVEKINTIWHTFTSFIWSIYWWTVMDRRSEFRLSKKHFCTFCIPSFLYSFIHSFIFLFIYELTYFLLRCWLCLQEEVLWRLQVCDGSVCARK